MTWLVWRQHRNQVYFAAAALAAFSVLVLITGLQVASKYHSALASCAANHACGALEGALTLGSPVLFSLVTLTLAVPGLLGVFWGGPLVARELETGTSQFAWMQSITRRRWLAVKSSWALLATAAWAGAVSALVTWWSGPENALKHQNFNPTQFDIQGIVPVGYALFAVSLGIAVGALLRRTMPALAITVGVFAAVRFVIENYLRPHYMTAITIVNRLSPNHRAGPTGSAWELATGLISPSGQVVHAPTPILGVAIGVIPSPCHATPPLSGSALHHVADCMSTHGFRWFITFQPANRYWAFQGIETGIFVLLAAVLIALTAFVVLRRDA